MNIVFSEHKPAKDLFPFVQAYWFGDFNVTEEKDYAQSVVPNGCIELIVHLTTDHCSLAKKNNDWNKSPDFTILGLQTRPYEVKFFSRVNVFGIRFYPDGVRNIFGVPPSVFLATYENGVDVFGKRLADFCAQIRDLDCHEHQLQSADSFIRSQLDTNYRSYDYTHLTMKIIRDVAGRTTYRDLTSQIPISERQLQREFKNQYGITVLEYMRLARMNVIYNYMESDSHNLTKLSNEFEFFDQSHFIREFKNYVGLTPGKFIKNREKFIVNPGCPEAWKE